MFGVESGSNRNAVEDYVLTRTFPFRLHFLMDALGLLFIHQVSMGGKFCFGGGERDGRLSFEVAMVTAHVIACGLVSVCPRGQFITVCKKIVQ